MDWTKTICPISAHPATEFWPPIIDGIREFSCPACGRFRVFENAVGLMANLSKGKKVAALAHAEQRSRRDGSVPTIGRADIEHSLALGN
jgi:hypothetical protein